MEPRIGRLFRPAGGDRIESTLVHGSDFIGCSMAGTCEQFAQAVVTAGMLSADAVQSFWTSLPAAARPTTADAFAATLVKAGRMTSHQAQQVLASLSGPSFGPAFSAAPPGIARPTAILPQVDPSAAHRLPRRSLRRSTPERENWAIKILGGAFATIVAPLLVTIMVNRMSVARPMRHRPAAQAPRNSTAAPASVTVVAKRSASSRGAAGGTIARTNVSPRRLSVQDGLRLAATPDRKNRRAQGRPAASPAEAKAVVVAHRQ